MPSRDPSLEQRIVSLERRVKEADQTPHGPADSVTEADRDSLDARKAALRERGRSYERYLETSLEASACPGAASAPMLPHLRCMTLEQGSVQEGLSYFENLLGTQPLAPRHTSFFGSLGQRAPIRVSNVPTRTVPSALSRPPHFTLCSLWPSNRPLSPLSMAAPKANLLPGS